MNPLSALFLSSGNPTLDRRHEWARGLIEHGEPAAAAELLEDTLVQAPEFIAGWFLLGEARETMDNRDGAVTAFRRALALDPDDRLGAGLHLARLGERRAPRAMSEAYVRTLFDQYARRFDKELEALRYNAPALLVSALRRVAGQRRYKHVLDLGCGTGLMGAAIRERADELVGIDLSKNMVDAAERKEIYDRLIVGDILQGLAEIKSFDLILAADVFVYFSNLEPVFCSVAKKLSQGGYFAFTVETHDGDDAILRDTLRFAHGEKHLRVGANLAGMEILLLESVSTRQERSVPVEGLLAVVRA